MEILKRNKGIGKKIASKLMQVRRFAPLVLELTIITNLTNLYPIKKMKIYGKKIGKIGNYCQLKAACCQNDIVLIY